MKTPHRTIVGQGLAGTCLAWELWTRGVEFTLIDRETGGSSRVAAGLINPVTGKNFEPSPHIAGFLPEAIRFYSEIESLLERKFWHPLPVIRLAASSDEWEKMRQKSHRPDIAPWLGNDGMPLTVDGWHGGFLLTGGGRLDTRTFLDGSREYFRERAIYQTQDRADQPDRAGLVHCEGAAGLITGRYGPHRCAKGEILTIQTHDWDETAIRIGAGGWLVPVGDGVFKAGSTYEWEQLDELPTEGGRTKLEGIARRLGGESFQVIAHEAGVRPILRRSEPLIGPLGEHEWMFNALGSKGSLYAPGMARRLAGWMLDGLEPEPEFDFRVFCRNAGRPID